MEDTSRVKIESLVSAQRAFFKTHVTRDLEFRIGNLKKFRSAILKYETRIADALWLDLHKSPEEAYLTETSIVLGEIRSHLKNLRSWARPKRVTTPLPILPSSSRMHHEPLGDALIIAPWMPALTSNWQPDESPGGNASMPDRPASPRITSLSTIP